MTALKKAYLGTARMVLRLLTNLSRMDGRHRRASPAMPTPLHGSDAEVSSILIWTMDRLGDVVRSTVAIRMTALRYPQARVVVVAPERAANALQNSTRIDELVIVRRHHNLLEQATVALRLLPASWDLGLILDVDPDWAMIGQLLFQFVGVRRWAVFDLGQPIPVSASAVAVDAKGSWITHFQRIATAIGADADNERSELFPTARERAAVTRLLQARGIDPMQPMFLIHPGGGQQAVVRQWPAASYAQLITELRKRWPFPILVSGLPQERELVGQLRQSTRVPIHDFCGLLTLRELIALISLNTVCIMNDTGPLHIAFALKRPTVAILGPTGADTADVPPEASVAACQLPCQPCVFLRSWQPCSNSVEAECLHTLTPVMVIKAVEVQINRLDAMCGRSESASNNPASPRLRLASNKSAALH